MFILRRKEGKYDEIKKEDKLFEVTQETYLFFK